MSANFGYQQIVPQYVNHSGGKNSHFKNKTNFQGGMSAKQETKTSLRVTVQMLEYSIMRKTRKEGNGSPGPSKNLKCELKPTE